jgi:hypothetical protein
LKQVPAESGVIFVSSDDDDAAAAAAAAAAVSRHKATDSWHRLCYPAAGDYYHAPHSTDTRESSSSMRCRVPHPLSTAAFQQSTALIKLKIKHFCSKKVRFVMAFSSILPQVRSSSFKTGFDPSTEVQGLWCPELSSPLLAKRGC